MHAEHHFERLAGLRKDKTLLVAAVHKAPWWDILGYAIVGILAVYLLALQLGLNTGSERANDPVGASEQESPAVLNVAITKSADETPELAVQKPYNPRPSQSRSAPIDPSQLLGRLDTYRQMQAWAITDADLQRFRADLNFLVEQGEMAYPAISAYLLSGTDVDFESAGLAARFGYPSLRLALFDVLRELGGHQAENIWYRELKSTGSPQEIHRLGQYLEELSPGLYAQDVLAAARDRFRYETGEATTGLDIRPLFEVFQSYGDARLVPELEQVSLLRLGEYAAVTLAALPDGAGISSLARLTEGASPNDLAARFALQMLAQSAGQPEAQSALIDGMKAGLIPDGLWPDFAQLIAGTYQIQFTYPKTGEWVAANAESPSLQPLRLRQLEATAPGGVQKLVGLEFATPNLPDTDLQARIELIDTLLQQNPSSAARHALMHASEQLWTRSLSKDE